jgi:hypothetical protein
MGVDLDGMHVFGVDTQIPYIDLRGEQFSINWGVRKSRLSHPRTCAQGAAQSALERIFISLKLRARNPASNPK